MSGLGAIVTFDGWPVAGEALDSLVAAVPHRWTDGVERWTGPGAALASLVTSRTAGGRQPPRPVERAGLVVVADARIDNREELVAFLERRGYLAGEAGRTSDPELILAAHRCWGERAPARLIGDFAYLLWARGRRRLLAPRDPMGMRPLYYRSEAGRRLVVGSEITQLLAVPGVPCDVDERGIAATLAGPYLPADRTVYAGIAQLAPACLLEVDARGARTDRFWWPDPARRLDAADERDVVDAFRARFARAVRDRLDPDRPTGLSLSGGTDSGSIAAMAGSLGGQMPGLELRTYSWALPELPDSDERGVSSLITDAYGLASVPVPGDDAWPLAAYPEHGPDRDDPFVWPYQALQDRTAAAAAADGVGVLLSGDRGDELVGDWIFDDLGLLRVGRARAAIAGVRRRAHDEGVGVLRALRRTLLEPWRTRRGGPVRLAPWLPPSLARRTDLADVAASAARLPRFDGRARSQRFQRLFMAQGARIATHNERTKARHGLGHADPYADRRLVELVLAAPQWRVQRRGEPKRLLRRAVHDLVPAAARARLGKRIPQGLFDRGLRDRGVATARSLLTGSIAAQNGWLDERAALAAYERYVATGEATHDFWWPLSVEWWLRRWWR